VKPLFRTNNIIKDVASNIIERSEAVLNVRKTNKYRGGAKDED